MSNHIKTSEGYDVKVPSQGQVDYNTVAGSLGIASFLGLNAGNILPNWGNGGWNNGGMGGWNRGMGGYIPVPICSDDHHVNRYELGMEQKLAAKDSEIAQLKANIYNDQKILEVFRYFDGKVAALEARNAEQAVRNQGFADAFREVQKDIDYKINLEAERRNCADQKIVNYANSTYAPKLITDYTAGTTSAAMTLYNPLCACSDRS